MRLEVGMPYFFSKLNPPRPSFAFDMNDEERRIMTEHAAYWTALAEKCAALLFGPVADPKGPYGILVAQAESEVEVEKLTAKDPVILSGKNFSFETYPMLSLVHAKE